MATRRIISVNSAKTDKSLEYGYLNGIIFRMPHKSFGIAAAKMTVAARATMYADASQLVGDPELLMDEARRYAEDLSLWDGDSCPLSTKWCRSVCIKNSGRLAMDNATRAAMVRHAAWKFFPELYWKTVEREAMRLQEKADKLGLGFALRCNGTTDDEIPDRILSSLTGRGIKMYDYTKIPGRYFGSLSHKYGYHLTFSYSGAQGEWSEDVMGSQNVLDCARVLKNGGQVAIPYIGDISTIEGKQKMSACFIEAVKKHGGSMDGFSWAVVDGDKHDLTFLNGRTPWSSYDPAIIALKAKGKLRKLAHFKPPIECDFCYDIR